MLFIHYHIIKLILKKLINKKSINLFLYSLIIKFNEEIRISKKNILGRIKIYKMCTI